VSSPARCRLTAGAAPDPDRPEDDVLALTPAPLQTAGERAFFAELARWDTGGSVRAAVMASIPLVDGPLQRRLSDAVLFVPEGLAVVRVVEVLRQSGVVTAKPEGAWTIGPEGGPGDVLQLAGGGSTPLDGLMRAGMDVAMRLRRAGLEPGRIARLTVLVGDVTGLAPADGDLGEGDQVALLEPRSLLLGIARASRYAGVDNPRLWATADVRAALEALSLQGRGPTVEELNGEGFPYSPYVLRRPELLAPANMAASAAAPAAVAGVRVSPGAAELPAPVREQPSPDAIAQAVAASAAAAQAAVGAPPAPTPPVASPTIAIPPASPAPTPPVAAVATPAPVQRDTVAIDGPDAPPSDDGLGGLFANAEPDTAPPPGPPAPRTAVFAAQPPPVAPPPVAPPPTFWGPVGDDAEPERERTSFRTVLLAALGLVVVVLLGVGGWFFLHGGPDGNGRTSAAPSSAPQSQEAGPQRGTVQKVNGVSYTLQTVQVDDTCSGHAYGAVAQFFSATNCTGLSRALYSAEVNGAPVVVSVSRVRMPDTTTARDLRALADRNGSGNVNDLFREGVTYPGGPEKLSGAEYASAVSGPTVTIVESSWVSPGGDSSVVDKLANDGLELAVAPFSAD
jgi:hypothetical protein